MTERESTAVTEFKVATAVVDGMRMDLIVRDIATKHSVRELASFVLFFGCSFRSLCSVFVFDVVNELCLVGDRGGDSRPLLLVHVFRVSLVQH